MGQGVVGFESARSNADLGGMGQGVVVFESALSNADLGGMGEGVVYLGSELGPTDFADLGHGAAMDAAGLAVVEGQEGFALQGELAELFLHDWILSLRRLEVVIGCVEPHCNP